MSPVLTAARSRSGRLFLVLLASAIAVAGCAQLMADSIESLMKKGIELLTAGKYDEALAKFLEVVRREPKSWEAYLYMARAYLGKGSWTDALASGRKALELAPNRADVIPVLADAFLGAGVEALRQRRFSDAVAHLTEYVKLKPADFRGYLNLGRAHLGTGALGDALRSFVQSLGRQPDAAGRQQLIGGLLEGGRQALAAGQAAVAVEFLREYVRYDSANASAYLALGQAYLKSGQLGSAWSAFERVLELNPNDPEASQLLRGRR